MQAYDLHLLGILNLLLLENIGTIPCRKLILILFPKIDIVIILIKNIGERNWVFATNLNLRNFISLQPDDVNLWHFKPRLFDLAEFIAWNISGLQYYVANI